MKKGVLIILIFLLIINLNFIYSATTTTSDDEKNMQAWLKNFDHKDYTNVNRENIWKRFIALDSEKQTQIFNSLELNEKNRFIKSLIDLKLGSKGNFDMNRLKGLDSKNLIWNEGKLSIGKNLAYVDFENFPEWAKEIEIKEDKLLMKFDAQDSKSFDKERLIVLEGESSVNKEGKLVMKLKRDKETYTLSQDTPRINLLYGEGGVINVNKNGDISLKEDSSGNIPDVKIGDNFYRQFYSKNNKHSLYRPEDGNDESGEIKFYIAGDSPSNHRFIPQVKNILIRTGEGDVYTSRTNFINFFYKYENNYLNPVDLNKEVPYVRISELYIPKDSSSGSYDKKIDISLNGDYYMGFVANPGVQIGSVYALGKGNLVEIKQGYEVANYIYFKNGEVGTAVREGNTYVSGNTGKLDTSVDLVKNNNDNSELKMQMSGEGENKVSVVSTPDGTVTMNSPIWKGYRAVEVAKKIEDTKNKIVQNDAQKASAVKTISTQVKSSNVPRYYGIGIEYVNDKPVIKRNFVDLPLPETTAE